MDVKKTNDSLQNCTKDELLKHFREVKQLRLVKENGRLVDILINQCHIAAGEVIDCKGTCKDCITIDQCEKVRNVYKDNKE